MKIYQGRIEEIMEEILKMGSFLLPLKRFEEIDRFAQKLQEIGDCNYVDECMIILKNLSVPDGLCHVRYTFFEVVDKESNGALILGQPVYAGEIIDSQLKQMDLETLVCTALVLADGMDATSMGPGRWIASFALPTKDPGMLELALVLEPRQINDGSERARLKAELDLFR